jgi:hypothetical protein
MPWSIQKRGSKYCVIKDDDGHNQGCHDSRMKAERQRRALYAAEAAADGGESMASMEENKWFYVDPQNEWTTTTTSDNTGTIELPAVTSARAAEQMQELAEANREPWSGVLATIMSPTSDGRIIEPEIDHRDLPVPFSVQVKTAEGHMGSEACGRIEKIEFIPLAEFDRAEEFDFDEVREGALVVWGTGTTDGSPAAEEAKRLLSNGAGVSLDGLFFSGNLWSSEDLSQVDTEGLALEEVFEGIMSMQYLRGMNGKIAGVTVVNVPAFEEATVMVASAGSLRSVVIPQIRFGTQNLTASAAGLAPLEPPSEWFYMPELDEPTPLTVDEDGRVYGHLALWNQCHAAFASCERPPKSNSDYSFFHVGQLRTEDGSTVNVGRITVGENGRAKGGHASLILGRQGAMEHYDKTGCVAAFVGAKDGVHGIWLSGAVRSDAPATRVRDLRANPPSGDWRDYELVAVLSVPVPGFPIPRSEMRLVATGANEEVAAMVASASAPPGGKPIYDDEEIVGWMFPDGVPGEPLDIPTYKRRMAELAERRKAL